MMNLEYKLTIDNDTSEEAIKAWNQRADRTCKMESSQYDDLMGWFDVDLSCGHVISSVLNQAPNYCPICGAKVVE